MTHKNNHRLSFIVTILLAVSQSFPMTAYGIHGVCLFTTEEDKSEIQPFKHTVGKEVGLSQTEEAGIAIAFATARREKSFSAFADKYIADDTRFFVGQDLRVGRTAFVEYWDNLEKSHSENDIICTLDVRHSRYTGEVEVCEGRHHVTYLPGGGYEYFREYRETPRWHFIFHVKDGKIDNAAYILDDKDPNLTCDMDHAPYRYDYILDIIKEQDAVPHSTGDRMPCPWCWSKSENLKHYDISIQKLFLHACRYGVVMY